MSKSVEQSQQVSCDICRQRPAALQVTVSQAGRRRTLNVCRTDYLRLRARSASPFESLFGSGLLSDDFFERLARDEDFGFGSVVSRENGRPQHGEESHVWADAGYAGIDKREEHRGRSVDWNIAMSPGRRAQLPESSPMHWVERLKASVRAKVEHPFRTIKRQFGYDKVRYRGLAKNSNRLHMLAAFSNLLRAHKYLPM